MNDYLLAFDWTEEVGLKNSHALEAASPKTRGRKGQSTPDPRKARRADHSDTITRELDRIASAMLRGTCPTWLVESLGADDYKTSGRTEADHALADRHVSRWASIPEVVALDPSIGDAWTESEEGLMEGEHAAPEPSFEFQSEGYRPRPLRLETSVRTSVRADGVIVTNVYRPVGLTRQDKRERTTFVAHGPAITGKPKTTTNSRVARGSDRRDAAVTLLATLERIGQVVTFDDWSVTVLTEGTKRHAPALKAQRGDGMPIIGPPRKVATLLSR